MGTLRTTRPYADVVADGHVREQRVVLEDGVDVTVERRDRGHVLAVEQDAARGRQLEAGDHPERRGLARPRRTEHREELAVADVEVDAVDGDDVAEPLLHALEAHGDGRGLARCRVGRGARPLDIGGRAGDRQADLGLLTVGSGAHGARSAAAPVLEVGRTVPLPLDGVSSRFEAVPERGP